ncbi:MAG TPA: MBL fold metallo-hydrolase [Atribacteraceae bacterium]|nr:MBL fold metallo-hydrolase [Atribacteraceae bacterium]
MRLQWFGHSFFQFSANSGQHLVIDPFDATVGYPLPTVKASVVLVSHQHFDHNHTSLVQGKPVIIDQIGVYSIGEFSIAGFPSYHDAKQGKQRGSNIVYRIQVDGLSLLHCGDLGFLPNSQIIEQGKPVDLLLVPVGEIYTLSLREAVALVEVLAPRVIVPMHYKTRHLAFELNEVDPFLSCFPCVKRLNSSSFFLNAGNLPDVPEVWVLSI